VTDEEKDKLAAALVIAWRKYFGSFGDQPHGTYRQLRAMLEFMPKDEEVKP
jgi:hypothetical protein